MAEHSNIAWTDATLNPWRGCTKISEGCKNCYAETLSGRNQKTLGVWGPNGTRVVASEAMWTQPRKWDRLAADGKLPDGTPNPDGHRPRVFCASLADVFEDWKGPMADAKGESLFSTGGHPYWQPAATVNVRAYPGFDASDDTFRTTMDDVRRRLFDLIDETPHLDWLLLTKRPENIRRMLGPTWVDSAPPRNVWLGTSVENQQAADERIPHLLRVPAAARFLSMEPLLGPVDLRRVAPNFSPHRSRFFDGVKSLTAGGVKYHAQTVDWVIVGGESGHNHRPMRVEWAADLARQCQEAGVRFFMKQDSNHRPGQQGAIPLPLFETKEFPCPTH